MKTLLRSILASLMITQLASFSIPALAHGATANHGRSTETPFGRPGKPSRVTRTIDVAMSDNMRFSPDNIDAKKGETLRLHITNKGGVEHEFVLGNKAELQEHADMMKQMPGMKHTDANSIQLAPGQSGDVVWTFSKMGSFLYACLLPGHWEMGMEGHITVAGSAKETPLTKQAQ